MAATWNFKSGSAAELSFFNAGKLKIQKAKETYTGTVKGANLKYKGIKTNLDSQLASKSITQQKYNQELAAALKVKKDAVAAAKKIKKDAVAEGKQMTADAFSTGYMLPGADTQMEDYVSPYSGELGALVDELAAEEELPTTESILQGIVQAQQDLNEQLTGYQSGTADLFGGIGEDLESLVSGMGNQTTSLIEQMKINQEKASKLAQSQSTEQLAAMKNISDTELAQAKELAAQQLEQSKTIADAALQQQLSMQQQSAEEFEKTYKLQEMGYEQQQAFIQQQKDIAEQQQQQAQEDYQKQLTQMQNQAYTNLTPELQIQPKAQGLNIGGTSMFKAKSKQNPLAIAA